MIKSITKIFFKGVLGVLPLSLSLYFLYWFFSGLENFFDTFLLKSLPQVVRIPGLGVGAGFVLIFCIGILLSTKFFSNIHNIVLIPIRNIPLVKSIFSALEDLMGYFTPNQEEDTSKVVKVNLSGQGIELVGLLTLEELSKIEGISFDEDKVAVFIPMSYALGGYTIFVSKSELTITDMKVEQAMKLALTGWMKTRS